MNQVKKEAVTKSIFRDPERKNWTVIGNNVLSDERISYGARGLFAFVFTLPDEWDIVIEYLTKRTTDSRRKVSRMLDELERYGYVEMGEKLRNTAGAFSRKKITFHEKVAKSAKFAHGQNTTVVKCPLLNTNKELNTKKKFNKLNLGVLKNAEDSCQEISLSKNNSLDFENSSVNEKRVPPDLHLSSETLENKEEKEKKERKVHPAPTGSAGTEPSLPVASSKQKEERKKDSSVNSGSAGQTLTPFLSTKNGACPEAIDLIHELYTLFGKATKRLPTSPNDRSHKTSDELIDVFNALRSGTFVETFKIDEKFISENKALEALSSHDLSSWVSLRSEVIKSASRLLKIQKTRTGDVLSFFFCNRGVRGTIVPTYSLFLKYLSDCPISSDISVQISKIKSTFEEKTVKTAEKFYSNMMTKHNQKLTEMEDLRFWNGISLLNKWYRENIEKIDLVHSDGNYKPYMGNEFLFICTLFNWLDLENGAWGKLFPDIIQIKGKQWGEFLMYCKRAYSINLDGLDELDTVFYLERAYRKETEIRQRDRESELSYIRKELSSAMDLSDEELNQKAYDVYSVRDQLFHKEWETKLAKARKGR
jgi:hypothetical protein